MKRLLFLLLFIPVWCNATTYYVSSAGSDSNNGTSTGTPFLTLAKLQTVIHASDVINLRRGDTFTGSLSLPASVILQGYSTGANPIISGFDALASWTSLGGNKYRSNDPALLSTLKVFTLGGSQRAVARFPRTGYATYTAFSGTTGTATITSSALGGTYTGEIQVVMKKNHFDMQTYSVTSVSPTGVVTYTGAGGNSPTVGYGTFLQNANEFLQAPGDWAYDGSGNVTVYSTGGAPSNVKASRVKDLLTITGNSVIVNGIDFTGANEYGITTSNRSSFIIENCNISLCDVGIFNNNATGSIVQNCTFNNTNGNALTYGTSTNNTITNCTVINAGMIPGAATEYSGIRITPISATNTTITGTTVSFCGYNGFFVEGQKTVNHVISHDCTYVLDDGGCWYEGVGHTPVTIGTSTLSNSIFYNAVGAPTGTSNGVNQGVCVYLDDNSNNVTLSNITAYNAGQFDYFLHNNNHIIVSNCTGYNATTSVLAMVHDALGGMLSNITLSNNQFINLTSFVAILKPGTANANDLKTAFTGSNQKYANTSTVASPFQTQLLSQSVVNRNLASWQTATATDGSSTYQLVPSPNMFVPNPSSSPLVTSLSGTWKDLSGTSYVGSITVPAYSGTFIYFFGVTPPLAPSITISPSSYTFPINLPIANIVPVNVGGAVTLWSILPVQPIGLTFSTSTGVLSGTPTLVQSATTYTIRADNVSGFSTAPVTITVFTNPASSVIRIDGLKVGFSNH